MYLGQPNPKPYFETLLVSHLPKLHLSLLHLVRAASLAAVKLCDVLQKILQGLGGALAYQLHVHTARRLHVGDVHRDHLLVRGEGLQLVAGGEPLGGRGWAAGGRL